MHNVFNEAASLKGCFNQFYDIFSGLLHGSGQNSRGSGRVGSTTLPVLLKTILTRPAGGVLTREEPWKALPKQFTRGESTTNMCCTKPQVIYLVGCVGHDCYVEAQGCQVCLSKRFVAEPSHQGCLALRELENK